jgi:hypothetical protein
MYRKSSPWDYLPRHTKGYLWIAFLVAIFLVMALSENNAFDGRLAFSNPIPVPAGSPDLETVTASTRTGAGAGTGEVETQDVIDTVIEEQRGNYAVSTGLDPKDVVILVKTGATYIWRRMPGHMSTTLGDPALTPNIIYYSDSPDNINGNEVIDVLANVSSTLKQSPDFKLYNNSKEVADNNLYLETGSMEGDSYLPGGWRLDKYKFVPMFQHAANTLPGKKWYIYMEDDNYYFWETFYAWLATPLSSCSALRPSAWGRTSHMEDLGLLSRAPRSRNPLARIRISRTSGRSTRASSVAATRYFRMSCASMA